jgi:hypothetical protein
MTRTLAPRLRRASVSSAAVLPAIARSIPSGEPSAMSRLAIGLRQSTWVARPAGAMSRFVLLQTPPSTYSRPPICTGAKIHGTEQDACTASATLAAGDPGAPNTTRRPLARSTATTRRRPSKRAPALSTRSRIAVSEVSLPGARPSSAARNAVLPFAPAASAIGASGVAAAPASRTASRATVCRIVRGRAGHCAASRFEPSDATSALVSPAVSSRCPSAGRGRRGRSPATSAAPTSEPADVPTTDSVARKSCPVASSMPARRPLIHASPSVPPLASTSTSGRRKGASATSVQRTHGAARGRADGVHVGPGWRSYAHAGGSAGARVRQR